MVDDYVGTGKVSWLGYELRVWLDLRRDDDWPLLLGLGLGSREGGGLNDWKAILSWIRYSRLIVRRRRVRAGSSGSWLSEVETGTLNMYVK